MKDSTGEFSFLLKPSEYGIGVFATHGIKKDTFLRLFGDEETQGEQTRELNKQDVPEPFLNFCAHREETVTCPDDFGVMPVGWHMNHSNDPNAYHIDFKWYACRDIEEGEEIVIDYNSLGEPDEAKDDYYFM